MDIILEASPYLETNGSDKAKKELYNQPFHFNRIANKTGIQPEKLGGFWESDDAFVERLAGWKLEEINVLFDGWVCKDMFHYQEIVYKNKNIIITFEPTVYEVNYLGKKFLFPVLPDTIDDFINDLKRIGIKLFWKSKIADIYGITNVTSNKKIIDYYGLMKNNGSGS
jgi:hypothetical protein